MASYSNMTCLIQLNSHCWYCADKVRVALQRLYGVTSVIVDSSSDTVKVTGNVDPHYLLSVVQPYDIHARLLWAKPTPVYPYGYSRADQHWCNYNRPLPHDSGYYQQSYWRSQHHSGCNIM